MSPGFSERPEGRSRSASVRLRITLGYAVAGGLWILLSDRLMMALVGNDLVRMGKVSTYKGWIFIALTSLLLYLFLPHPRPQASDDPTARIPGLRRLTTAFLLLATLTVGLCWALYRVEARHLLQDSREGLRGIGAAKQGQVDRWVNSLERQSRYATSNSFLAQEVEGWLKQGAPRGPREEAIRTRLVSLATAAGYLGIQLRDLEGGLRLQVGIATPCTEAHREEIPLVQSFHWTMGERPLLIQHFTAPLTVLRGGLERPVARLAIELDPAVDLISRLSPWPGAAQSGRTVFFRLEGSDLIRFQPGQDAEGHPHLYRVREPLRPGSVFAMVDSGSREGEGRGEGEAPVLASLWNLRSLPFTLAVLQDRNEVEAPLQNLAMGLTLGGFLLVLASALIIRQGWRQHRDLWELRNRMATEQRLEVEVAAARDFYLEVLEELPNPCCRWEPSAGYGSFNRAWMHFTGRTTEQERGEGWLAGIFPEDAESAGPTLAEGIRSQGRFNLQFRLAHRDGTWHWVAFHGVPLFGKGGAFAGFVFTAFDLQEVKEVEQELRRTRDLYMALSLTNQAIVKAQEGQGLFQTVCDIAVDFGHLPLAWIGLVDRTQNQVIPSVQSGPAQAFLDTAPYPLDPELPGGLSPVVQAVLRGEAQVSNRFQEDGRTTPWHEAARRAGIQAGAAFPLRQEHGVSGVMVVYAPKPDFFGAEEMELLGEMANDLTLALDGMQAEARRAEAETALKASETRYRNLLVSQGEGFASVDPQEAFTFANPAAESLFGVAPGSLVGRNLAEFTSPSMFRFIQAQGQVRAHGASATYELEISRPDGQLRTLLVTATPQSGLDGSYQGANAIFRDITDRKRTERALRESERTLAQAQALARLGSWTWKAGAERPEWSRELFRILDRDPGREPLSFPEFATRIPEPAREPFTGALDTAWERGIGFQMDLPWRTERDRELILHATVEAVRDPALGVIEVRGCFRDATAEREAEGQVRQAQHLIDHSPEAIMGVNSEGRIVFVNPTACHTLGYSREELLQRSVWEIWPDPDPERWAENWRHMIREGEMACESLHRRRSGEPFPVELQATLVEFRGTQIAYAFLRDITERKRAEAALHKAYSRLEDLLRAINEATLVMTLDPEGRILEANERVLRLYGCEREELLGRTLPGFCGGTHPPRFFEELWERLRAGEAWHDELCTLGREGQRIWLDTTIIPCRAEGGRLQEHLLLAVDTSARKEAESQFLAASAERAALLEAASVARVVPWTLDLGLQQLQVGDSALEVLGRPSGVFRSLPGLLREMLRPEEQGLLVHAEAEARQGRPATFEAPLTHGNGQTIWTRWTLAQRGKILHGVIQDITEPHELQAQVLQSQKLESLGTLLSGISHDFNNLLMAILGYTEVLTQTGDLPAGHLRGLEVIRRAARRGSDLVSQLLRFSRKSAPVHSLVCLNETAAEVRGLLKLPGDQRIEVHLELDPELPPTWADAGQIHQVLMNLAVNGRDAIPGPGTLTIRTGQEILDATEAQSVGKAPGAYVFLEVEDTGTGMPPEVAERAFEPFYTTKAVGKGTGLGLSVVHGIVETHRGFIRLHSRPGEGTRFRVLLPLLDDPKTGLEVGEGAGPSLTVMLVDEPGPDRDTIQELLLVLGHTVQVIEDPTRLPAPEESPDLALVHPGTLGTAWLAHLEASGRDLGLILAQAPLERPWSGRLQPLALIQWPFRAGELLDALHRVKGA